MEEFTGAEKIMWENKRKHTVFFVLNNSKRNNISTHASKF